MKTDEYAYPRLWLRDGRYWANWVALVWLLLFVSACGAVLLAPMVWWRAVG